VLSLPKSKLSQNPKKVKTSTGKTRISRPRPLSRNIDLDDDGLDVLWMMGMGYLDWVLFPRV
jgi:hypothetical protein